VEYDEISANLGRHYPAIAFVEWLTDEWRAASDLEGREARRRSAISG
jgi:hypothetical protein